MTTTRTILGALAASVLFGSVGHPGHAQDLTVVRPLPGYSCMLVRMPSEKVADFGSLPHVLRDPSATASAIGLASNIAFVKTPLHVVNGFAEVVQLNGVPGWLPRELLSPYRSASNPSDHCTPSLMSNGRLGAGP